MENITISIEDYNNLLTKSKCLDIIFYSALERSYLSYDNKSLSFDSCSGVSIENLRYVVREYFKEYESVFTLKVNEKISGSEKE